MTAHPEIPCKAVHPPESRPARGTAYDVATMCKPCWLFVNDERYNALWSGRALRAAPPVASAPAGRAGSELARLIRSLGLHGNAGCGCGSLAARMDAWGVEGCEARRDEIIAHLRGRAAKLGWLAKLQAGALAAGQGLIVNPLDPASSLLDEALRRAKARLERTGATPVELSTKGGD